MQQLNKKPIKVNISVEKPLSLRKDAFNTVAFFTEVDYLEDKDYVFHNLSEVTQQGFTFGSATYNFCRGVFLQNKGVRVVVRLKRKSESYQECYDKRDNSEFYFVVIESKLFGDVYRFNQHIQSELKLQFFSTSEEVGHMLSGSKIVHYWQPTFSQELLYDSNDIVVADSGRFITLSTADKLYRFEEGFWMFDGENGVPELSVYLDDSGNRYQWDWYEFVSLDIQDTSSGEDAFVAWDADGAIPLDLVDHTTEDDANKFPLYYPEAAWIGRCAYIFPSRMQWLFKTIEGVTAFDVISIPLNANTSTYINGDKVTLGTGCTAQGVRIEQQVFLDWLKWAIQQNMWNLLYVSEKVPATQQGLTLMEHRLDEVLRYSLVQEGIQNYKITSRRVYDKVKVDFKFKITLTHSILGVDVIEGVVTH